MPSSKGNILSTLERSPDKAQRRRSRMSKQELADALQRYNDRQTAEARSR